jgi:hypothetical protein
MMRALKFLWLLLWPAVEFVGGILLLIYVTTLALMGFPGFMAIEAGHYLWGAVYFAPVAVIVLAGLWNCWMDSRAAR